MADVAGALRVVEGNCSILGRTVVALYRGADPVVPATVYLRYLTEDDELSADTVRGRAYGLLTLWRYLEERPGEPMTDFWDINAAVLTGFKRHLKSRVDLPARVPHRTQPGRTQRNPERLSRATANKYLEATRGLVEHWLGLAHSDVRPGQLVSARGPLAHLLHRSRVYHKLFRIRKTGHAEKRRPLGLPPELCSRVWEWLESQYPTRPEILGTTPKTATQWERWRAAERDWEARKLLYYRDRAIWAYLLMTGLRIGELCRQREDDFHQADGVCHIVDRAEDRHLGSLKTGEGEARFGARNPYLKVLDQWEMYGLPIADKIWKRKNPKAIPCPMLFRNNDGGPLTEAAVRNLVQKVLEGAELWRYVRRFSPHITRHTIASLMLNNGVPLNVVQAFLRHESMSSTQVYAVLNDPNVRASLDSFVGSLGDLIPAAPRSGGGL